jgi:hypothetical protein
MSEALASVPRAVRRTVYLAALAACAVWALASPPALRAQAGELQSMFVTPPSPTTDTPVVLHALTTCSNPFDGDPSILGQTITLNTTSFGLYPPCAYGLPPYEVSFNLGKLNAGTYVVDVIGNGGVPDGTVVFTFPFQVGEAGGPKVNPQLSVSPGSPTTNDPVVVQGKIDYDPDHPGAYPQLQVSRVGNTFQITNSPVPLSPLPPGPYPFEFDLGELPAGLYHVDLDIAGQHTISTFTVSAPLQGLSLQGGQFQVKVLHGADAVPAVQLSDESGYFWFYDSANMEVTVKLLDGRGVNGHYWLFAASMTDQPFTIQLLDLRGACTGADCIKTYTSTAGKNKNFIDLAAAN